MIPARLASEEEPRMTTGPALPIALLALTLLSAPAVAQDDTSPSPEVDPGDAAADEAGDVPDGGAAPEPAEDAESSKVGDPPADPEPAGKIGRLSDTLEIGARLHAGWGLEHDAESDDYDNEFYIKRARVQFEWVPVKWLKAVIELEASEAIEGSLLRDAFVRVSPMRQLELQVGQFKKPFSGLELLSPSKRKLIDRGPGNGLVVEDLMYGDRDLGVQVSGRLVKSIKLDYAVGAFNGSGPNLGDPGRSKDLAARLELRPVKPLELAANGSFKFFADLERQPGKPSRAWAAGLDARLTLGGFRLYVEGLVGQNHAAYISAAPGSEITADNPPEFLNALGVISYKHEFDVSWGFAIEPAFKAELLEPSTVFVDDHVLAFTPGLNTYFGEHFRLMINGEFIRSARSSQAAYPDQDVLMVLACVDI
jgi:hypothetical protein